MTDGDYICIDAFAGFTEAWPRGEIIVVDDCAPDRKSAGAYAAHVEFVSGVGLPVDIRYESSA